MCQIPQLIRRIITIEGLENIDKEKEKADEEAHDPNAQTGKEINAEFESEPHFSSVGHQVWGGISWHRWPEWIVESDDMKFS